MMGYVLYEKMRVYPEQQAAPAREIAHRAKRYLYIIAVLTNKDTKAYVLYA